MMSRRILSMFVLAFLVALPLGAREITRALCPFDTEQDLKPWKFNGIPVELVSEHSTKGGKALKVVFSGKETVWPGFSSVKPALLSGWKDYETLCMDVYNPSDRPAKLSIRIDDDQTREGIPNEYTTWYSVTWNILPGKNHFEIELGKMLTPVVRRQLDIDKIKKIIFFMGYNGKPKDYEIPLFFDNFVLKKTVAEKLPDGMFAFDFGPPESRIQSGFTAVVDGRDRYEEAKGWGFVSTQGRWYKDLKVPDAVDRDSVRSADNSPLVFALNLQPGKYRLWVSVGNLGGYGFPIKPFQVNAAGKEIFRFAPEKTDFLECLRPERDYTRNGMSIWDKFVAPRYVEATGEVESPGGKLDISLISDDPKDKIYLCSLILYPAGNAECEDFMQRFNKVRKETFNRKMREIKPATLPPPPEPTPDESARGYILAAENYMLDISPYWVPTPEKRLARLSIAACPGEYEPAVFIVYPLRDQKGLTLTVSDLSNPNGAVIPASTVAVDRMVYHYCVDSLTTYSVKSGHLVHRNTADLESGVPRQFWLTARIPDNAKAGRYMGTVTLSCAGKKAALPLEVEVYPFKLEIPKHVTYAHVYAVDPDDRRLEMDLNLLAEHGFNSVTANVPNGPVSRVDGHLRVNFETADRLMKMMKKVGMTGPVPLFNMSIQGEAGGKSYPHIPFTRTFGYKITDQAYFDDLTKLTSLIIEHAAENDWLPVIMYPSTEISNDANNGPELNRKLIQAIRKAGDVVVVSSVNTPQDVESVRDLDIVMYNAAVPINEETINAARDAGCKLWFQNIGGTRYNDGLYLLRTGAVGRRQWVLNWYFADPYSDFQMSGWGSTRFYRNSTNLMFPSSEGTLPSVALERMREGVDDYRYFYTLSKLIEKAGRKGGDAAELAKKARAEYDTIINSCPLVMNREIKVVRDDGWTVNKGFVVPGTFDRYRSRAARLIVELKRVVGE